MPTPGRPIFQKAGFDIVYDKSYPLGTQDLSPVMKAAKAAEPDAFVAWSYPPDTFGLAEQAKIEDLNVKAYYSAVAVAFPAFKGKFGSSIENVLGAGGIQEYAGDARLLQAPQGSERRRCRLLGQPGVPRAAADARLSRSKRSARSNREAITAHLKSHTYKTIIGEMDVRKQKLTRYWTVGQWQQGIFQAVAGVGFSNYKPVQLKTGWA